MTTFDLHARHARFHGHAQQGLGRVVQRIAETVREWHRRVHGRRELGHLSDAMLKDIGVSRAEATYLASKPFWRE